MAENKKDIKLNTEKKTKTLNSKISVKRKPEKSLVTSLKQKAGRTGTGSITIRHRGGGEKRLYRILDFKQEKYDISAEVLSIEYDPVRSAHIALIKYDDNTKSYILAPVGLKVGQRVLSSQKRIKAQTGNRMPLKDVPLGNMVYNIELIPGKGGQVVRSAGANAVVLARDGGFTHLKMPSSEVRMFKDEAMASVGQVSNPEHGKRVIGKAGRKRHMGIRPTVRGKVMNPKDHPHGGGEGKQPIGLKHPKTPWGAPALGYKTRNKKKASNKFIVRRRNKR